MHEALLYQKLEDQKVKCGVCNHHCIILPEKRGICGVRENHKGILHLLVYGKAISEAIDPIEKKPLFHFLPGTLSLSIATTGCNFRCENCQNWQISQVTKGDKATIIGENLSPEQIVQDALNNRCASIAYTYTEPTIFLEYALDTMKLAYEKQIKNVWVTNGYMSKETLDLIIPYLDAVNVDLKFFNEAYYQEYCGAKLKPILDNLKYLKKKGIWVEVTTLIIPDLSDDEKMLKQTASFIAQELGVETPWHVTKFSPEISFKMENHRTTPSESLERAYRIGLDSHLKYVYTGNVPGMPSENTYCSECGKVAIERFGFSNIKRYDTEGKCSECGTSLDLILE